MKWWKIFWIKLLKKIGLNMATRHGTCIASLEEHFQELSDEEYFLVAAMLDAGFDCDSAFNAIHTSRRKRTFLRKLKELGIGRLNREHLLEMFLNDIRGSNKVDELIKEAYQVYLDKQEQNRQATTTFDIK